MKHSGTTFWTLVLVGLAFLSWTNDVSALDTAFTYQGRLEDSGSPANGTYDFQFYLFDDPSTGTQIGTLNSKNDVTVADGLFSVSLDFGESAFTGEDRWLLVRVRPGSSTGSFTGLSPRRKIEPAPYSIFADTIYKKIVIVRPVGSDTENGTALLSALSGITDNAADNRYLIKIEPGTYDLGTSSLTMKEYVDVQGSGESMTTVKSSGNSFSGHGTITTADNCTLSDLRVENTGGNNYATGVYVFSVSPTLHDLSIDVSGATHSNYGISVGYGAPEITDVDVSISNSSSTSYATGMDIYGATPSIRGGRIVLDKAANSMSGVAIQNGGDVSISGLEVDARNGSVGEGIFVYDAECTVDGVICGISDVNIARNISVSTSGEVVVSNSSLGQDGCNTSYGIYLDSGLIEANNLDVDLTNAGEAYGCLVTGATVVVSRSTFASEGTGDICGLLVGTTAFVTADHLVVQASGSGATVQGCRNTGGALTLSHSSVEVYSTGIGSAWGVDISNPILTLLTMNRIYCDSNGEATGVRTYGSVDIRNSDIVCESVGTGRGVDTNTSGTIKIDNSQIEAGIPVSNGVGCTGYVANTKISGGFSSNSGTMKFFNCYDENYDAESAP